MQGGQIMDMKNIGYEEYWTRRILDMKTQKDSRTWARELGSAL